MRPNTEIILYAVSFLFGSGILIGIIRLIWNTGKTAQKVEDIDRDIDKDIKPTLRNISDRVSRIEGALKLSPLAASSPLHLTDAGKEILKNSGMGIVANRLKDTLLIEIKKKNPKTAYDIQEVTKDVFSRFNWPEEDLKKFKDYSFQSGKWSLADIFEVGAIYFRDITLKELGYKIEDLEHT